MAKTTASNLFIICCLLLGICSSAYALNLDKLKTYFLNGDYGQAISEGEKLLAGSGNSRDIDELYYILGLSYLKDGNFLRASDIFEIILGEFKASAFTEETYLALGDTYFLKGDFAKAKDGYEKLINNYPGTKLRAEAYYRLAQVGYKTDDAELAKEYSQKLKEGFPANPELKLSKDLCPIPDSSDFYYTVQVGAFSNKVNAGNLTKKLIENGYPAYVEELSSEGKPSYRVRVGKVSRHQEAQQLQEKLSFQGYPTKICP